MPTSSKLPTYSLVKECSHSPHKVHGKHVFAGILRDAYRQSKYDLGLSVPRFLKKPFVNGVKVPYEVRDDLVHGRGLFVTQDIPKGTVVWDGESAYFYNDREFAAFLRYLPPELQCDVILWAYPKRKRNSTKVSLALDEGSYMNDGGPQNANCGGLKTTSIRYIRAGEQLAENYAEYVDLEGTGVPWFHWLRELTYGGGRYIDQGAPTGTMEHDGDTGEVAKSLFHELDAFVESQVVSKWTQQLSVVSMGLLTGMAVVVLVIKRRLMVRRKTHGL